MMSNFSKLVWYSIPDLMLAQFADIRPQVEAIWEKQANPLERVLELAQIKPAVPGVGIPNRASPLLGMLVGGMAGSGLGYGLGYAGEKLMPDKWRRGKLRRTLALVGGGLGAALPAGMGLFNVAHGLPFNDMSNWQAGYNADRATNLLKKFRLEQAGTSPALTNPAFHGGQAAGAALGRGVGALTSRAINAMQPANLSEQPFGKAGSDFGDSTSGAFGAQPFDPEEFNQMLWQDPRINSRVPMPTLAAASGLVTGAANLPYKSNSSFVTPSDIARMAAGMGSGYISGLVVGKVLGSLMGMPEDTQDTLKNTGMYAGLIKAVIPMAFGG